MLPLGISFYTFQSVSYIVDVYKREIPAETSYLSYLLFLSFFPQLVAGPIVTAKSFLPQIRKSLDWRKIPLAFAIFLILLGLFKKVVLADHLAESSEFVFRNPSEMDIRTLWVGLISYSFQIYCDFSGYTDIAQGAALMFGFRLPENFSMPYLARGFSEFWTKWHISLSSWLKKYLYFNLGGNRNGVYRTYLNLLVVMLLGGLWHGANWNFVFWGFGHGVLLVLERAMGRFTSFPDSKLFTGFYIGFTFLMVSLLWIFFRTPNFSESLCYLQGLFIKNGDLSLPYRLESNVVFCAVFIILGHWFGKKYFNKNEDLESIFAKIQKSPVKVAFLGFFSAIGIISTVLYAAETKPFVYFVF
ncbi:MBOAT family protein [Leptospira sp. 96542]|nr:MBOAT family protein [Leptospira sp. 96542]